ncbi:putative DNA repair and transcription protein [Taphrina deformans PYCC 5710]|uniref:Pre-mRNA-splicing factor SYF1 n=1 Tax=Taphrina deformans (strain PYCC 5710 / ATCC 11124 / CBS 356.35 / IMI 108563 / JCM 9778 / NBRC 8474) TaxID=1097556 RepID=R4XAB2_TAPDE|nr:putative DNA repair and transcription protein [Taphrina deformans PYCC 5710]|eukprot:CCG81209.1 putative DNA repair and transcription protein [Taphrina deformans PYCC 5710]
MSLASCIHEGDLVYEEDLLRDPYSIKFWLRYINEQHNRFSRTRNLGPIVLTYERACRELPGSYKLWKMYLDFRLSLMKGLNPGTRSDDFDLLNECFDRALVLLNKMPRLWTDYLEFLMTQTCITKTRRTFDAALRALPITQHSRVWQLYTSWSASAGGLTRRSVLKRNLLIEPDMIEDYVDLLVDLELYDEAAREYTKLLDNNKFRSSKGKSQFQLWSDLCDLLVKHPRDISGINVEAVVRGGINKFTDQRGRLWTSLATYWITSGDLEKARDIFEEGITSVTTVRDFAQIFDAYAEFEEFQISRKMEEVAEKAEESGSDPALDLDLDIRMMRFEQLMDRRPFLVSDVLLRQNPHNVIEWEKRVGLWGDNKEQVVETYTKAIKTINPKLATGKYQLLWRNFSRFYEDHGDLNSARKILEKATKVVYRSVNELADLYCEWAEMELRNEAFDRAVLIMKNATQCPKRSTVSYFDDSLTPQARIHKSSKVWMFYVDLVESVSTIDETRAVYDRMFELKIATPQTVVNYANMLDENQYYEESFKVYERGLDLFKYPVAFELWNLYLTKFMQRYKGTKLERARDLFEQALRDCPPKFAKPIFLMYAIDLEEEHGLVRNAMAVLNRACDAVDLSDRMELFQLYIAKSATNFGLTSTRPIYERALDVLPDAEAATMSLRFASMETRLSEIDRARAIYGHGSQFADPVTKKGYWTAWHDFEVRHGNEDTYATMLQIKRSVASAFNTDANYVSRKVALAQSGQDAEMVDAGVDDDDDGAGRGDAMANLEGRTALAGFVSGGIQGARLPETQDREPNNKTANPDEIALDEDL